MHQPIIPTLRHSGAAFLAALALWLAPGVRAQTLTGSSGYSPVTAGGSLFIDTWDQGSKGLDPSKQNGLNGSSSNWDLVGSSTLSTLQVAIGASETYFRIRLADYKASGNSGSAFVLMNNGSTTFGVGALIGGTGGTVDGTYFFTPTANAPLTSSFTYNTPTALPGGAANLNYSAVTTIEGASAGQVSGNDAYLTFKVLNSDLTTKNAAYTINPYTTSFTVFTNTNSTLNTNINGDWMGSGGNLSFGTVPEPATWISSGAMLGMAGLVWWRRRRVAICA